MVVLRRSLARMAVSGLAILALAAAAFAAPRLGAGDWPKYKHDAYNSGRSAATVVATPTFKWVCPLGDASYTAGTPNWTEPIIDSSGSIYVTDAGTATAVNGAVTKVSSAGAFQWRSVVRIGQDCYGTGAVWNDGTSDYILTAPGWTAPYGVNFLNPSTGIADFFTPMANASDQSPSVGPDGTIYAHYRTGTYASVINAIDPATKAVKWTVTSATQGNAFGSDAITTVDDAGVTKNLIIHVGYSTATTVDVTAIRDDGTVGTVVWTKSLGAVHYYGAALSNDGKTAYFINRNAGSATVNSIFALDVATGTQKWALSVTGTAFYRAPVIGADGTIYTGSTGGTLYAFTDNGTTGSIKWSVALPGGGGAVAPAVISSSPTVIYIGASGSFSQWFHAVRDDGTVGTVLWSKSRAIPVGFPTVAAPCVANDGTVYCQWGDSLVAFQPGFTTAADVTTTVTGKVTDAAGSPIDAYVSMSAFNTNGLPLIRNNVGYARTDSSGNYSISVVGPTPGTYYIAAWGHTFGGTAIGYVPSDPIAVTINSATRAISGKDITLQKSGVNVARSSMGATVKCNNEDPANVAANVIDGNLGSRWITVNAAASYPTAANPATLRVDLGSDMSINQATFFWESACAGTYKLQCLANGKDPDVEANWTTYGVTVFTNANSVNVPMNCYSGPFFGGASADPIKFPATTGRYWRVYVTYGLTNKSRLASMWEMELNVAGKGQSAAAAKSAGPGKPVALQGKVVTIASGGYNDIPSGVVYVEEADRSSGIRVDLSGVPTASVSQGNVVDVAGITALDSTTQELYVVATQAQVQGDGVVLPIGMNSKAAGAKSGGGMLVRVCGKIVELHDDYLILSDGGQAIKVTCPMFGSFGIVNQNDMIAAVGVLGTDGTQTVLHTRDSGDIQLY